MAFYSGYDTDDLTQRQYHYFMKLNRNEHNGTTGIAFCFLRHCVQQNHCLGQFDNYDGDCDFLERRRNEVARFGINVDELYVEV